MAKRTFLAGATSQTIDIFIQDSSSTVGLGLAGLAFNTANLKAYYRKGATGSATAITLATQTVGGAWSSGGFVEIDATNMKGWYRFDVPDTVLASTPWASLNVYGATNMAQLPIELEIVSYNPFTANLGLNNVPVSVNQWLGGTIPAVNVTGVPLVDLKYTLGTISPATAGSVRADAVTGAVGSVTGAVGSVTAGVTVTTNNDKTAYALTAGERSSIADATLDRDMSTGADSGSSTVRTMRQALRFLRNKWTLVGTTLTVYKEDDSTSSWTGTVTTDASATPITANDPAGP